MARNYAALPHDYLEEMDVLSDAEFGRLCRALLQYSMTGEEVQLQGAEKVLMKRVYMQERRYQESYQEQVRARREAGKKGASKRWQTMADDGKAMADDSKNGQTETETETETNTPPPNGGRGKGAGKPRGIPPTLDEVAAYVQERHSKVDPQGFIDFYAAKGWMIGKTPMKDWKAACRNAEHWERWDGKKTIAGTPKDVQPSVERAKASADRLAAFLAEQDAKSGEESK